jgi:translation initiation factor 1
MKQRYSKINKKEFLMPDRLVYSTDGGRIDTCPVCGRSYKQCQCDQSGSSKQPTKKSDGIVRVMRDRKGRGGKTVTVIAGVMGSEAELATLAQQLKKLCGSGGTIKDGNIEIQGDHCDKVQAKLTEMGYKVKRAGG